MHKKYLLSWVPDTDANGRWWDSNFGSGIIQIILDLFIYYLFIYYLLSTVK